MTTKRLVVLQLILALGLGSVFLLPRNVKLQASALDPFLPQSIAGWEGTDQPISDGERQILGADTQFARKLYTNAVGDEVFASIVVSGPDMNTSIHRPERCLPAQGWTITDSKAAVLPTLTGTMKATRLQNMRGVRTNSGQSFTVRSLNYYWFVGHSDITASHYERTWIDIRDRVLRGENQQWAYVTISATITKDHKIFGRTEKETDDLICSFIKEFVPRIQKISVASRN